MLILTFCPTLRLEPEVVNAILNQSYLGRMDVMFTFDNPYEGPGFRNVQYNYEKMRGMVLERYDKVWVVESDTIPPKDALEKLLEIDAPVVGGLYALRHGPAMPNVKRMMGESIGSQMNWREVKNSPPVVETSGVCMGCVVIDRSVLEDFSFIQKDPIPPDGPLMEYCWKKKFKQMARLDVMCGHVKPDGQTLWPQTYLERIAQ